MSITGDPAGIEAAADALATAGRTFTDCGDDIASHGREVTADWFGLASTAAGAAIESLSTRTSVGSTVCAKAAAALRVYARELRAAQAAADLATTAAANAAAATASASAAAQAADAMESTTNDQLAAKESAVVSAASAADDAQAATTTAASDLSAAAARAQAANTAAAAAIDALTAHLASMDGAASSGHHSPTHRGGGNWWDHAWSWTVDHASDISAVAGTAAAITAFIPGVDLVATPLLLGAAVAAGGLATAHDMSEGENGQAVIDGGFTLLNVVPGVGAVRVLAKVDDAAQLARRAEELTATNEAALSGPVLVRAPPNPTAAEVSAAREYARVAQEAQDAGRLSTTGRVSTAGALRRAASKDALRERVRAMNTQTPYSGHVGHVPDTTWTGDPEPYAYMDLPARVNRSLGGQASQYPIGYKPTGWIFVEPTP